MEPSIPLGLLGGLSPARFMRRHWQKKPLLVRQAVPGFTPLLSRAALFELAGREGVESRLLSQAQGRWRLRHGPFARRALPALNQTHWTLLVQGVDLHLDAAHQLLGQFRFVPDARLDDLMISYASDGGGVGPHFDSYDVFLLQAHGQRRWRIGRQRDLSLVEGLPLKILAHFEPEQEYLLEPGDMLYLPPHWAHDGVAVGECMTYSIGFRQPSRGELARELLQRLADEGDARHGELAYRDPGQAAVAAPGEIPAALFEFARETVRRATADASLLALVLGEWLTEPKPGVWFDAPVRAAATGDLVLDRRTRMMYDARHVFINGEGYRAGGRDARLMRRLADERRLGAHARAQLTAPARELVDDWWRAGWLHAQGD
ncbi:MAG TPA: cupin domain-containing protein [Ottowia sp.]|uniref:cupin domain-containing protein n=1 Tax=Ottowia sp. TaxID=1898956 RepID=UPI002C37F125|nr:cupin domain-containing protein [Ottowia sp.]HMN20484.1 cupin domain-containing protein [Ottowia sp.]